MPASPLPTPAAGNTWGDQLNEAIRTRSTSEYIAENLPERLSDTALSATFAPAATGQIGYRMVGLGDSTMEGYIAGTRADNWLTILSMVSAGRIHLVKNAGKGGDTTGAMFARIDADVLPFKPHFCIVQGGGNDWSLNVDFETTKTNLRAIVAKLRAHNIVPILSTITPRPSTNGTTVVARNEWIRRYAESERLILLDFNSILADPVTGGWKSGQSTDQIHPLSDALYEIARYAYKVLTPYLAGPVLLGRAAVFNEDTSNRIKQPLFLDSYDNSGPIPGDWGTGGGTGRIHTISAPDPAIGGARWMGVERTAGTDRLYVSQFNDNSVGWAWGERIAYGFWLRVPTLDVANGAYYAVGTSGLNEPAPMVSGMTRPLPEATFVYKEFTMTNAATSTTFTVNLYGVGKVEIARPKMVNLTKLGVV